MKIIFTALLLCLLIPLTYAQGPGQPFFPETANGALNVSFQFHSLRWQNPGNTVYNKVYLSFDSAAVAGNYGLHGRNYRSSQARCPRFISCS